MAYSLGSQPFLQGSPMLDATATGVFPIAPTPFHPDGRVDEVSTDRMTDFFQRSLQYLL